MLSGIGYGTGASGLETVSADTKTRLAPDLQSFKSGGLCCATYVSYVYYNYLPNVANRDVSAFACPLNPRSPAAYNTAANGWVQSGAARRISFTQSGSVFTPAEEIPLGSLIVFKNISSGAVAHVALYAGAYDGKHFVTHVENERGPEISTIEGMSKGSSPEAVVQVVVPKIGEPVGTLAVYKTDENGNPLAGAKFSAALAENPEQTFLFDTTDQNGNGKINFGVPYGTYIIREVTFPEGYTYSGQTEWLVTVGDETQNVLIRAVNKLKSARLTVIKTDAETGEQIKGITGFKIKNLSTGSISETYYTDENGFLSLPEPLTYGSYELIEVSPPGGYILNSVPVSFGVDGSEPEIVIKLTDSPEKGRISVIKTGEVFSTVNFDGNKYTPVYTEQGLQGAKIEILAAEDIYTLDGTLRIKRGEPAGTLVTDEEGKALSGELYLGKYLLKEKTAPEGFVLSAEPYELTVTAGTVTAEIHNERRKVSFSVKKELEKDTLFGIGDNGEIFNCSFGLFSKTDLTALDGSVIPADGLIEEAAPNEEGEVVFTADMPFNAECYIKETKTDEHYALSGERYLNGDTVTNRIIRGQIEGIKTEENGQPLRGALIGLFYPFETVFEADTALAVCETDEAGGFLFGNVPKGEWTIRELKAPDGYILSEEKYNTVISGEGETIRLKLVNLKIPDVPKITETPKTGDGSNPYFYLTVLILSAVTAAYLQIKKQRSNLK